MNVNILNRMRRTKPIRVVLNMLFNYFLKLLAGVIVIALILVSDTTFNSTYAYTSIDGYETPSLLSNENAFPDYENSLWNLSIYIPKDSYVLGEPVVMSLNNYTVLLENLLFLEIVSSEDSKYALKYLGALDTDITFIPPASGEYVVKLFYTDSDIDTLVSYTNFNVEDIVVEDVILGDISEISVDSTENTTVVNYEEKIISSSDKYIHLNNSLINHKKLVVKSSKFEGSIGEFQLYYHNISSSEKTRETANLTIANTGVGAINWHKSLNITGADIESNVVILPELIIVESQNLDTSFNSTATLTMYDVSHALPIILKNDKLCVDCSVLSYIDGVLIFDVKGFSNYTVVENTSLRIWDNNEHNYVLYDGNNTKYANQNIFLYANYTDTYNNISIVDADCKINFNTNYSQFFVMEYNSTTGLYYYIVNFESGGAYNYNISCNKTGFNILELADDILVDEAGDLVIYPYNIEISNRYPAENEEVWISATINNIVDYSYTDVLVRFYDGNPFVDGVIIGDKYVNITGLENLIVNMTWPAVVGSHNIYVYVDPFSSVNDLDRASNVAYNSTFTTVWQTYYGSVTPSKTFLGSANTSVFINWTMTSSSPINIYVANANSNVDWSSLKAFTKNITEGEDVETLNDFYDLDLTLGTENFTDSVNSTYSVNGYPTQTSNYTVYDLVVSSVPDSMSTNNTNFYTGILWDSSDSTTPYYSYQSEISLRPDLLFVTKVNYDKEGLYGIYDYELKVPAYFRDYKGTSDNVLFYYEIK
jgi:hypothetical protein